MRKLVRLIPICAAAAPLFAVASDLPPGPQRQCEWDVMTLATASMGHYGGTITFQQFIATRWFLDRLRYCC